MDTLRRFWAKNVLNKIALLMSFSLIFCCCGWTGSIGGGAPAKTSQSAPVLHLAGGGAPAEPQRRP